MVIKKEEIAAQLQEAGITQEEYDRASFVSKTAFISAVARAKSADALTAPNHPRKLAKVS